MSSATSSNSSSSSSRPNTATTHARVGLIGNPSDGYGGAAIAFTFDAFAAVISLEPAPRSAGFEIRWQGQPVFSAVSLSEALATPASLAGHGGARLVLAAGRVLSREMDTPVPEREAVTIAGDSSIPLQAGLAGSSAIVIGALRVLSEHWGQALGQDALASLALRAETEELAIAAGPMDRIAQVRGGLHFMDFAADTPEIEPIDAELPTGLYIAWDREEGVPSGRVHGDLRQRYEAADPKVMAAMPRFRSFACQGREALERGDSDALARLFDDNFALRRDVVGVGSRDEALVAIGREYRAGVKLTGSGGAVVGLAAPEKLAALADAYTKAGHGFLLPEMARVVRAARLSNVAGVTELDTQRDDGST